MATKKKFPAFLYVTTDDDETYYAATSLDEAVSSEGTTLVGMYALAEHGEYTMTVQKVGG